MQIVNANAVKTTPSCQYLMGLSILLLIIFFILSPVVNIPLLFLFNLGRWGGSSPGGG